MKPETAVANALADLRSWLDLMTSESAIIGTLWREAANKAPDRTTRSRAVELLSEACDKEHALTGDCEHSARLAERLGLEPLLDAYDEANLSAKLAKRQRQKPGRCGCGYVLTTKAVCARSGSKPGECAFARRGG